MVEVLVLSRRLRWCFNCLLMPFVRATVVVTQSVLVLEALRICTDLLAPKGTFVTKVFRSTDYSALLFSLNQLFDRVDATKPVASRNESAEVSAQLGVEQRDRESQPFRLLILLHDRNNDIDTDDDGV